MIFHKRKAIFFHIGKAAGTAIEHWFENKTRDPYVADREVFFGWDKEEGIFLQHANIETMMRHVSPEIMNSYYKFAVVRNPFSRMVSCYYYFRAGLKDKTKFPTFESYVQDLPNAIKTRYVKNGAHTSTQVPYTHYQGKPYCNNVCHFETMPKSLEPVQKALLMYTLPPKVNTGRNPEWPKKPTAEFYTPEMKRIIQDVYAVDFTTYGYSDDPEKLMPLKERADA